MNIMKIKETRYDREWSEDLDLKDVYTRHALNIVLNLMSRELRLETHDELRRTNGKGFYRDKKTIRVIMEDFIEQIRNASQHLHPI